MLSFIIRFQKTWNFPYVGQGWAKTRDFHQKTSPDVMGFIGLTGENTDFLGRFRKTRTTFVVSNGRYTFYQIPFIKYHLSNSIYQILFIKYHLSNILHQIPFAVKKLTNFF